MAENISRSLTMSNDPVARLREMHDLDAPVSASQERSIVEASELVGASASQRSTAATVSHSVAGAPPRDNETTQPQRDESPNVHRNASTTKRAGVRASQRSNEELDERSGVDTDAREHAPPDHRSSEATQRRRAEATNDPVRDAMKAALRRPYTPDGENAPSTSSTIRMPSEVWERLDMAARLEGMTKQAIIAEALRHHLLKIGRNGN